MDQVKRWELDDFLKERKFENLELARRRRPEISGSRMWLGAGPG